MNRETHSSYHKPNRCKSQQSPEMTCYTLPGVTVGGLGSGGGEKSITSSERSQSILRELIELSENLSTWSHQAP